MLTVDHVTKKYGRFTALTDISLDFENGVYGLIAPNGAGKTTLIRMLATLSFPTNGEIRYNGTEIGKLDEAYREVLGYLPQQFGYYKNETPRRFLRYLAALKGLNREKAEKRINELLELVALTEDADRKMKKFSGGMVQRVGIAEALLNDPKVLLLDEPTAGLDPKERVRFRNILSTLSKDRVVLLSTHIVSDVESVANKIILLKDHRVFCCDSPEKICSRLAGKVFEETFPEEEAEAFSKQVFLLSERQEGRNRCLRYLSSSGETQSGRAITPGLEDVFLDLYRDDEAGAGPCVS